MNNTSPPAGHTHSHTHDHSHSACAQHTGHGTAIAQPRADADLKDPVCGMTVTARSVHHSEHMGHSFFFCSPKCKTKFDANPMQYMGTSGVVTKAPPAAPVAVGTLYTCPMHPEVRQDHPGTFMYHPHADEMTQMAMGMMGFWVTHPKDKNPLIDEVNRDFCFLLNAYDIDPGSYTPKIMTMLDFNLWSWNSRIFPGIDSLNVRLNDKVRIRIGNLTMTNHPIHLHGHEFLVTGTDGGPTPKSTRWYEVTTDVAVGQMRQIEFLADEEGDWAFHCHKSHHTMNAMGHNVPTLIGVDHTGMAKKINSLIPEYMVMGERGMADMTEMEMPIPDNTAPMMTGEGPFGSVEMGGMFSVLKVRRDQKPGDYSNPGWFKHPQGTVAHEYTGPLSAPARFKSEGGQSMPRSQKQTTPTEVKVRKPSSGHSSH